MKKSILLIFLVCPLFSKAQAITFYPFTNQLSFATPPEKPLWLDLRLQLNSPSNSLSTEISPQISMGRRAYSSFYLGGGVKFNYLNSYADLEVLEGYFIDFGFRATPFEKKFKNVQMVFELSPFASKSLNYGNFRANLGIGYVFNRKEK